MKKRVNGAWVADKYDQYQQNTATVENSKTIPIYSDGSNLTDYSFEGQCNQASTPAPSSPVEVEEFGNQIPDIGALNAIGEHIDSLNLATGLYSHKIKQIIFDGSENWTNAGIAGLSRMSITLSDAALMRNSVCSHYIYDPDNLNANNHCFITSTLSTFMFCDNTNATDLTKWTTFLSTQYANGTPLTVWYILATPTTETLTIGSGLSGIEEGYTIQTGTPTPSSPQMPQTNAIGGKTIIQVTSAGQTQNIILSEPLRKIGNYADSVNSEGVVTRRIKKLKISEINIPWVDFTVDNITAFRTNSEINKLHGDGIFTMLSNSYKVVNLRTGMTTNFTIAPYNNTNSSIICVRDDRYTTASEWLAENGDVELYYVLATPTTESVTLPTIPTFSGFSNIEIGTSLAPSKFEYDLGKMFVAKGQGKVRQNGEWV